MKKYKITYPVACGVLFCTAFCICFFVWKAPVWASVCLALCAASYGWIVSRITLHIIDKDNTPKTWQLHIYAMLISAGWTVAMLSARPWLISLSFALCVGSALLFLGVQYNDENDNGIPDIIEKVISKTRIAAEKIEARIQKQETTAEDEADDVMKRKYKPLDDNLENTDDVTRPMCYFDGEAKSINEALDAGKTEEAEKALEYISSLEEKKEERKEEGENE